MQFWQAWQAHDNVTQTPLDVYLLTGIARYLPGAGMGTSQV